jgi:hypothetical protein
MIVSFNHGEATKISFYLILTYFALISIILTVGRLSGDILGLAFFLTIFVGYIHDKQNSRIISVFLAFLWLLIFDFFVGGDSFRVGFFSKVLFKPGFIFFGLAFIEILSNYKRLKIDNIIRLNFLLFLVTIISLIVSPNSFSIFITRYSFFYLYLILFNLNLKSNENQVFRHGLHLVFALATIQTIVSALQVYRYIEPSRTQLDLGEGKIVEWTGGIGDLASGTFGAMASPDTSWFQTFVFGLILCYSIYYKSLPVFILSCIVLLQYAFVDSKTILAVSLIFVLLFIYYLYKDKFVMTFRFKFLFPLVGGLIAFGFVFVILWESFYSYIDQNANYDSNFETVKELSNEAFFRVLENIHQWGKFKGLANVFETQNNDSWIKSIIGFGPGNYSWKQVVQVLNMDIPIMKMNNFTRSFSSIIIIQGELGVIGLLIIVSLYVLVFKKIKNILFRNQNLEIRILSLYLSVFIIGIFINAFIYTSLRLNSKSIFTFWFIFILFYRYARFKNFQTSQNISLTV